MHNKNQKEPKHDETADPTLPKPKGYMRTKASPKNRHAHKLQRQNSTPKWKCYTDLPKWKCYTDLYKNKKMLYYPNYNHTAAPEKHSTESSHLHRQHRFYFGKKKDASLQQKLNINRHCNLNMFRM